MLMRLTAAAGAALTTPARAMTTYDWAPLKPEPPCIFPEEVTCDFDRTFGRGLDELTVTLRLLVSNTEEREGARMLYGYLAGSGSGSIKAAIEAARGAPGQLALGGAADDLHVTRINGVNFYDVGGLKFIGADFVVRVIGSGG